MSIALVVAPSPFYSSPIKGEENGRGDSLNPFRVRGEENKRGDSLDSCESRERKMGGATE